MRIKTIDKLLERIKKEGRSIGKKIIIPTILTTTLITASAQDARAENKGFFAKLLDKVSIEASYSYSKPDPLKDFYKQMNDNARIGNYTGSIPMPEWRDMKSPETLTMPGIAVNFEIYEKYTSAANTLKDVVENPEEAKKVLEGEKNRRLKIYLTAGYEKGKASSNYNEVYEKFDNLRKAYYNVGIERDDTYNLTKPKVGIKIEKGLSNKVSLSGSANIDFYNVKGNADMTILVRGPPITDSTYIQWRSASYSGKSTGFSLEAALNYALTKNISLGAGLGYRNASVKTSGTQTITASTWPQGYSIAYLHNPTFTLDGIYGEVKGTIKF